MTLDPSKLSDLRGTLQHNISLARFTSWRVGGLAETLFQPADLDDLIYFLKNIPADQALTWLGLGSNTLVRDGGVQGIVIVTQGKLNQLKQSDDQSLYAQAGVACPALARYSARLGWRGLEFLAGIPGTVGGALAMNAGCHGGEIWNVVSAVETIDRRGTLHRRTPAEYEVAYRSVKGVADEWFVAGHFVLKSGDKEAALEEIRELLAYRTATQPTNEPSCGSVFRNPPNDHAARLIEKTGLKGKCIGGACVSTKHANFIVNEGTATAADIEQLINFVHDEVLKMQNVSLIREVKIIGVMR